MNAVNTTETKILNEINKIIMGKIGRESTIKRINNNGKSKSNQIENKLRQKNYKKKTFLFETMHK